VQASENQVAGLGGRQRDAYRFRRSHLPMARTSGSDRSAPISADSNRRVATDFALADGRAPRRMAKFDGSSIVTTRFSNVRLIRSIAAPSNSTCRFPSAPKKSEAAHAQGEILNGARQRQRVETRDAPAEQTNRQMNASAGRNACTASDRRGTKSDAEASPSR